MSCSNAWYLAIFLHAVLTQGTWIHKPGDLHIRGDDGLTHTLSWLVILRTTANDNSHVTAIADSVGLINLGQVLWLEDHFFFVHPAYTSFRTGLSDSSREAIYKSIKNEVEDKLARNSDILKFHVEVFRRRSKRNVEIKDPYFNNEWYLVSWLSTLVILRFLCRVPSL